MKNYKCLTLLQVLSVTFAFLIVVGGLTLAAAEEPQYGGTLTVHSSQTFKDLNPMICRDNYSFYVQNQIFDELVTLDPETLEPKPYIAKDWEFSEDGTKLTFYLHEGITFHNGEKLTAEDVEFTFEWILDPENGSPRRPDLAWIKELKVLDEYTVQVITKEEYAPYGPALIQGVNGIVPKDTFQEMGREEFNSNPVGSGPFKFVEWKRGDHITLTKNEDYWLKEPYLDKVIFKPIPKLNTAVLGLEKGDIDIIDNIPAAQIPHLKKVEGVKVLTSPSVSTYWVGFNASKAPFSNRLFRKAVYQSFSMDAAIQNIFQGRTDIRAYGEVPPSLWANDREYLKENVALKEDDESAKKIFSSLKELGVIPKNFSFKIYCPPDPRRKKLSTIMATNLKQNGINATVQPLEWGAYLDALYRSESNPVGKCGVYVIGWTKIPDPNGFLYYFFHSDNATLGAASNWSYYYDPKVDMLIDQARSMTDQEKRAELYVEAQRRASRSYIHLPAYHLIENRGVRERVHGFRCDPIIGPIGLNLVDPFTNVWVEH